MRGLTTKEKGIWAVLAALILAAVIHAFERLFIHGSFQWEFTQPVFWSMLAELTLLFLLLFGIGRFVADGRLKMVCMAAVLAVFFWIHVILIPLVVSGLYLGYICMAGRTIRGMLERHRKGTAAREPGAGRLWFRWPESDPVLTLGRDFLVGALAVICLFCLMSAVGAGSIRAMSAAVLVSAGLMLIREAVSLRRHRAGCGPAAGEAGNAAAAGHAGHSAGRKRPAVSTAFSGRWPLAFALGAAFLLTMFCLQAGRMNVAVDYDSIWYGVRGAYILNNGRGIYENLGTVSVVYTYPKGWETLTLPLVLLPSYSFQISFNLWLTVGALLMAWRVAGYFLKPRMAAYLTVLLASIPGITNMGITAKTDTITLFLQLIMIRELLICLTGVAVGGYLTGSVVGGRLTGSTGSVVGDGRRPREEADVNGALYYSFAAFLFSWICKPTAMVFSTAVYGMGVLGLIFARRFSLKCIREKRAGVAGVTILALAALAGIWARTWLITGLPVTSVFSSLLTKLGFQMKYPYNAQSVPDSMGDFGWMEKLKAMAVRLYGVILNPADLDHVMIAWGSLIFWLVICLSAAWILLKRGQRPAEDRKRGRWFYMVFFPFLAVNIYSLFRLYQVDGNYFMLLYVLTGIFGFRLISGMEGQAVRHAFAALALPVIVFSAVLTGISDWGWSAGLSPINPVNRGYYDQLETRHAQMAAEGKGTIWAVVAEDPRNRMVVFGDHPNDLVFPCSVQSVNDVSGSDGNLQLTAGKTYFSEFMEYAETDYVYVNARWTAERMWAWTLLEDLIEYGYITPVLYEQDNMLARVAADGSGGQITEKSRKLKEDFLAWRYPWLGF